MNNLSNFTQEISSLDRFASRFMYHDSSRCSFRFLISFHFHPPPLPVPPFPTPRTAAFPQKKKALAVPEPPTPAVVIDLVICPTHPPPPIPAPLNSYFTYQRTPAQPTARAKTQPLQAIYFHLIHPKPHLPPPPLRLATNYSLPTHLHSAPVILPVAAAAAACCFRCCWKPVPTSLLGPSRSSTYLTLLLSLLSLSNRLTYSFLLLRFIFILFHFF